MYWWDNVIHHDQEVIMFAKSVEDNFEAIKEKVAEMHPYEVPCIVKIAADANAPYAKWLKVQIGS
jgi:periplasmic divalent cation tolerance protein